MNSNRAIGDLSAAGTPPGVTDGGEAHPRWYALRVRSRAEFAVQRWLQRLGITEFLPTYREDSEWSDRKKAIDRPLFPGYLFIRTSGYAGSGIAGVIEQLQPEISDREIADVRRLMAFKARPAEVEPELFAEGKAIVIRHGAMRGLKGVIACKKGQRRLVVCISMLHRAVSVELDQEMVRAA